MFLHDRGSFCRLNWSGTCFPERCNYNMGHYHYYQRFLIFRCTVLTEAHGTQQGLHLALLTHFSTRLREQTTVVSEAESCAHTGPALEWIASVQPIVKCHASPVRECERESVRQKLAMTPNQTQHYQAIFSDSLRVIISPLGREYSGQGGRWRNFRALSCLTCLGTEGGLL